MPPSFCHCYMCLPHAIVVYTCVYIYIYTYTYSQTYIYIYICVCVCVCVNSAAKLGLWTSAFMFNLYCTGPTLQYVRPASRSCRVYPVRALALDFKAQENTNMNMKPIDLEDAPQAASQPRQLRQLACPVSTASDQSSPKGSPQHEAFKL